MPSRPGLLSMRVKTTNMPASVGAADQRLDAVEDDAVADDVGVGPVVRDIGAGVRLGHADRQDALAGARPPAGCARLIASGA